MSKLLHEINLMQLVDLIQTHYAVGYDPTKAGQNQDVTSNDPIYKDAREFLPFADALYRLMNSVGTSVYKPFPYSDFRVENMVLYYPVSSGNTRVRFGMTFYDLKEAVFMLDTTRSGSPSLVVLDYNKFIGRELSAQEKDDLSFLLNIYRTGRSPMFEVNLLKELKDEFEDLLIAERSHLFPGKEDVNVYLAQMKRITDFFSDNSSLIGSKAIAQSQEKITPLIRILMDYLQITGIGDSISNVSIDDISIDSNKVKEWTSKILEPIHPTSISEELASGKLSSAIYIFQFLAHHPGMLEKVKSNGAVKSYFQGTEDSFYVSTIYQARNSQLLENMKALASGSVSYDEILGSNAVVSSSVNHSGLFTDHFKKNPLMRLIRRVYTQTYEDKVKEIEDYFGNKPSDELFEDLSSAFDFTNTGLIPMDVVFSADPTLARDPSTPGLGHSPMTKHTYEHWSTLLGAHGEFLVKLEEEMLRETEFKMYHWNHLSSTKEFFDFFDITASSVIQTGFSGQSTLQNTERFYNNVNFDYWRGYPINMAFYHISVLNGKDVGAVNPLNMHSSKGYLYKSQNSNHVGVMIQLANELSSKTKGSFYRIDFDVIRGAKLALERILTNYRNSTR